MNTELLSHSDSLAPPRRRHQSDDSLIPLINIVFLLLVFFMVAGQIRASAPAEIDLAQSSASNGPPSPPAMALHINVQGNIWLDGAPLTPEQLTTALNELEPGQSISLYADRQLKAEQLSQVLNSLPHQALTLHLLTQGDEATLEPVRQ